MRAPGASTGCRTRQGRPLAWLVAAVLLLVKGSVAPADDTAFSSHFRIQDEGTMLPARPRLNFTGAGVSCTDNGGSARTDCVITGGGGGGGGTTRMPIATCVPVGVSQTLYMASGTCVDATEVSVQQPFLTDATMTNMKCFGSKAQGLGNDVVLTALTGSCGVHGSLSGSFTCTLTGGASPSTCTTLAALTPSGTQCWSIQVTTPPSLANTDLAINCTVEVS